MITFYPAGRSWAVRRAIQRYDKLCKLSELLETDISKVEEALMLWTGEQCYSYDFALDLCLSRALLQIAMPWEK